MNSAIKNIVTLLGIATIAFAGYYLYTQRDASSLNLGGNSDALRAMRANSQLFIERRKILDEINFDMALFEDDRFQSLQSFDRDVVEQNIGRPDPFADVNPSDVQQRQPDQN